MKLTYDGHGLNNADDPYRERVATFSERHKHNMVGHEIARAVNAHDALVSALREMREAFPHRTYADGKATHVDADLFAQADAALELAEGMLRESAKQHPLAKDSAIAKELAK